jgi:hypothetical protein
MAQTRKCWRFHVISAPYEADIDCRDRDVRLVPIPEVNRPNPCRSQGGGLGVLWRLRKRLA